MQGARGDVCWLHTTVRVASLRVAERSDAEHDLGALDEVEQSVPARLLEAEWPVPTADRSLGMG